MSNSVPNSGSGDSRSRGSRSKGSPSRGQGYGAGKGGKGRSDRSSRQDDQQRKTGSGGRIPAPPDLAARAARSEAAAAEADERQFRIERVDDRQSDQAPKRSKSRSKGGSGRKRRSRAYVDDIKMGNVAPATATKLRNRLSDAATAFEAERFTEAEQLLLSIQRLAPDVAEVHELLGLTNYRLGRWRKAITELERFHELTRSVEQHPVMADCHRAMKHWNRTEDLWLELGAASPAPEIIEEGRIVQAGTLADRDRVVEAIRFLEKAPKVKGKPGIHHLRRWYATADLYERAGDNSRARRLFADIANADPTFGDAAERAASL